MQDLRTYWQPQAHFWLAVEQLLQFPQTGVCATVTSDTTTTTTTTSEEEEKLQTDILKLDSFEVNPETIARANDITSVIKLHRLIFAG